MCVYACVYMHECVCVQLVSGNVFVCVRLVGAQVGVYAHIYKFECVLIHGIVKCLVSVHLSVLGLLLSLRKLGVVMQILGRNQQDQI